jgi:CheY-like chemotaxis protein
VLQWLERRESGTTSAAADVVAVAVASAGGHLRRRKRVLLIEDSAHFQNLVRLLIAHEFPDVDLHVAEDGIIGLIKAGELQPDVLLVDLLLPGVDGATLVSRLRAYPPFQRSHLIVVTSLDAEQRTPYAMALADVRVVHKPQLVEDLPGLLRACMV